MVTTPLAVMPCCTYHATGKDFKNQPGNLKVWFNSVLNTTDCTDRWNRILYEYLTAVCSLCVSSCDDTDVSRPGNSRL